MVQHVVGHCLERRMRTESARPWTHGALDQLGIPFFEFLRSKEAHHDALLIDHDADVPSCRAHPFAYTAYLLPEMTRWHVTTDHVDRSMSRECSLSGQPRRHPVQDPVHVVVNLDKAESFEPPRGSWAEVSSRIPAVHNHGSPRVEAGSDIGVDVAESHVDCSR